MVGFFLLVLVPIMISEVYFAYQFYNYERTEQIAGDENTVDLIEHGIENRVHQVEEFGNNITYSGIIIDFLQTNYSFHVHQSYEKYLHSVEFLESYSAYSRLGGSVNQRFFMANDTIPEGFGCFHRISRVENKQWYRDFCSGDANYAWIFADTTDYYDHYTAKWTSPDERFIFINKMWDYRGNFLGIFAVEVDARFLLQQYDVDCLYILHEQTQTLLRQPDGETLEHVGSAERFVETLENPDEGDLVSVMREIEPLGVQVGVVKRSQSMKNLFLLFGKGSTIIFAGMLLLSVIFGLLLHYILDMLRRCIDNIETSIFENKLMEEPERVNNELGRIIHQFNGQCRKIQQMIADCIRMETAEKEIQLRHMQNIISPHFFYNTLDVISSSMILAGQEEIADAVANFGVMMRYVFKEDKNVTLENELNCIESFITLQKVRYANQLELRIEVDDCLKGIRCPRFILQPVVENCIRHGMRTDGAMLHICLQARVVDGTTLELSVEDDGMGMTPERLEELRRSFEDASKKEEAGFGIGLHAVNIQLRLHSGNEFALQVRSKRGVGTIVIIPIRINGGD